MARLFGIGLVALEVVNGCRNGIACLFAGAYSMDLMANGEKRLERNHCFVIFAEIAADHENLFAGHDFPPCKLRCRCQQSGMDGRQTGVIPLLHLNFQIGCKGNLCDFLSIMSGKRHDPKASERIALNFTGFDSSDFLQLSHGRGR